MGSLQPSKTEIPSAKREAREARDHARNLILVDTIEKEREWRWGGKRVDSGEKLASWGSGLPESRKITLELAVWVMRCGKQEMETKSGLVQK